MFVEFNTTHFSVHFLFAFVFVHKVHSPPPGILARSHFPDLGIAVVFYVSKQILLQCAMDMCLQNGDL